VGKRNRARFQKFKDSKICKVPREYCGKCKNRSFVPRKGILADFRRFRLLEKISNRKMALQIEGNQSQ
jgi:hypothetical protein